ncbi:RNA 2',3'-cyclic phosphodiesterase [Nocardioides sp. cx-169]|uniref:RNA 2',3'-cyclic phosphodiesterase n=1 Tax=Nocardioides sp. cx-169 TaxID=2899080 RepID=UPI001E3CB027|nr:RNA 2',3'-cyclic phosphodiesterase [Nocardioides sp. cx-169]MCD4532814.1 RNA 2',3'-cyclic phosphodiesterase [Nocardioides sp. cx-169]
MGQRMFVAVVPPLVATEHLDAFLEPRREAAPFRWTPCDQLHVTLAFLESVPERRLDDLVERLGAAASRRKPFETRIAGGGAFPHVAGSRVLYAGLALGEEERSSLERLAAGTRTAAATSGIEIDGRRFRPHITVARIARPTQTSNWVRLLDAYEGPGFTVDRISLVASHLGEGPRRRPRYEIVDTFPLG